MNYARLSPLARACGQAAGLGAVCRNAFGSIVVRCVEIARTCDAALPFLDGYEPLDAPSLDVPVRQAVGYDCTEMPRGQLYHRYRTGSDGIAIDANIGPPTAQNQGSIEHGARDVVWSSLDLQDEQMTLRCEQAMRCFDPGISCATRFLRTHSARQ